MSENFKRNKINDSLNAFYQGIVKDVENTANAAIPAPATGNVGQVLKKTATGVAWADESGGGDRLDEERDLRDMTGEG